MIIKTLRWKVGGFGRLIDYVGKELISYVGKEQNRPFGILHNLRPTSGLEEIVEQFVENDAYRKHRKNGVTMYHEILSFHARDRAAITPEVLEDITREYLRIRAPRALAFASPHYDRDHIHVHIAISGTEFRSSKTLRMSNRTFTSVRRQIEHYQLLRYPELEHSVVHLTKPLRSKELQEEVENERPTIERCYEEAQGLEDFFDRVAETGIDESKYPFDTSSCRPLFDIDLSRLTELDLRMRELEALERLRSIRQALELREDNALDGIIGRYEQHLDTESPDDAVVDKRMEELESLQQENQDRDQEIEIE